MDARRVVIFSERLLPLTGEERRIEAEPNVELRVAALWSEDDIRRDASDGSVLIVGSVEPLTGAVLRDLSQCRLIVRRGVGYDKVDVTSATELGIPVAITPGASVEEVSDHALALLLALERRAVALDHAVRSGAWQRDPTTIASVRAPIRRLNGLTLGIVGLGQIGRALARKAGPLFGHLIGFDPYLSPEEARGCGVELTSFEELLKVADLISVHAPLTPETRHMFDARAFAAMKRTTGIVNTARGSLIDQTALIDALREGNVAGAALDVVEQEPIPDGHPLLGAPNLILTGHSAASSTSSSGELRRLTVDAAIAGLRGELPAAVVDRSVVDRPTYRLAPHG